MIHPNVTVHRDGNSNFFLILSLLISLMVSTACTSGPKSEERTDSLVVEVTRETVRVETREVIRVVTATSMPTIHPTPTPTPTPTVHPPSLPGLHPDYFEPAPHVEYEATLVSEFATGDEFAPLTVIRREPTTQDVQTPSTSDGPPKLIVRSVPAVKRIEVVSDVGVHRVEESRARELLALVPVLDTQPRVEDELHLPLERLHPPQTGGEVALTFPPSAQLSIPVPETDAQPLEILRYSPSEDVGVAPNISITFSKPMVPLTSHTTLAARNVPALVTPELSGEWYWLGTQTLFFQPTVRLAGSTRYTVEVPEGTAAADGTTTTETRTWEFETARLRLTSAWPGTWGSLGLRPDFVLRFNQNIDRNDILKFLSVRANNEEFPIELIDPTDDGVSSYIRNLMTESPLRTVAFRVKTDLPPDTDVMMTVEEGAQSAEGPLPTLERQHRSYRTYGKLRVEYTNCGPQSYYPHQFRCQGNTDLIIDFNHRLNLDSITDNSILISPPLPKGQVEVSPWGRLRIKGAKAVNTKYRVRLDSEISDEFGQQLGPIEDITFSVFAKPTDIQLHLPASMEVLNPFHEGQYKVHAWNLSDQRALLYDVEFGRWPDFQRSAVPSYNPRFALQAPGHDSGSYYRVSVPSPLLFGDRPVLDTILTYESELDARGDASVDLSPYLVDSAGHLLLALPLSAAVQQFAFWNYRGTQARPIRTVTWIQSTRLGVETFRDRNLCVVKVSDLLSGAPVEGVAIRLSSQSHSVVTDEDGHSFFDLSTLEGSPSSVYARSGFDSAVLPGGCEKSSFPQTSKIVWHAITDRNLYKPGETVSVKGWLRRVHYNPTGDVGFVTEGQRVYYSICDSRSNHLGSGSVDVGSVGTFDFRVVLPEQVNLGNGYIALSLTAPNTEISNCGRGFRSYGGYYRYPDPVHPLLFQIQEFRRPEFEATLSDSAGPHFQAAPLFVDASANYYGGGPLQGAQVDWRVQGHPTHYRPPGWDGFVFGSRSRFDAPVLREVDLGDELDLRGRGRLEVKFADDLALVPYLLHFEATVSDLSQQTRTVTDVALVHPVDLYVGAKPAAHRGVVQEPIALELIASDVSGIPLVGHKIFVAAAPSGSTRSANPSLQVLDGSSTQCQVESAGVPVVCELTFPSPGQWTIDIHADGPNGKAVRTQSYISIAGSRTTRLSGGAEFASVKLLSDQPQYQPGDVAQILVAPPFLPAFGTLVLNRDGIVSVEPIEIHTLPYAVDVPILDRHIPNLHVSVLLNGTSIHQGAGGVPIPASARGDLNLEIPPVSREVELALDMQDRDLEPGDTAHISVSVTNQQGDPVVGAEVVLLAVDEAILSLTDYQFDNPLYTFYPERGLRLSTTNLRRYMQAEVFEFVPPPPPRGGGGQEFGEDFGEQAFGVRQDFDPLAVFTPSGETNADGIFEASWQLPDTIGRFRVVAFATAGPRLFGKSETTYVSRLPLQIRSQWPRFLNFGDEAEMSVLIENQTEADQDLTLVVQSDGIDLAYRDGARNYDVLAFTVPGHNRRHVTVQGQARVTGESRILVSVFNQEGNDATLESLPIYVPASKEGFAAYGVVNEDVAEQRIKMPDDIVKNFGHLKLSTTSTLMQPLLDSYFDLRRPWYWTYPERYASRILANAALRDVLYSFQVADLPEPVVLDDQVQSDIKEMIEYQGGNGGFPLWQRNKQAWPMVTVHCMFALAVAREAGYDVPEDAIGAGLRYLSQIESHYPYYYTESTRRYITAYALYVRSLLDDSDPQAALHLLSQVPKADHPLEVVAWSILVLHADPSTQDDAGEWMDFLLNRVAETTSKASFTTSMQERQDHLILHSDRRVDAVVLRALMTVRPESDLIPKVVQGILAARTRHGHWGSSQDNVFVLLAMDQYFRQYEAVEPDFHARAWIDDTMIANTPFQGRETVHRTVTIPMAWLFDANPERILIQRAGEGKLYYRLGLEYVPADLELEPRDRGFTLQRTYSGLDDPNDVWQDESGVWHVKLGARVRIEVTMVATGMRHHVQMASPLPAGLEFENPSLKGNRSSDDYSHSYYRGWYYWPWYDHQQLLDERALAITSWLYPGIYKYSVTAQATTAGRFQVPPAEAHEIYTPETFGYGPSEVVVVESALSQDDG